MPEGIIVNFSVLKEENDVLLRITGDDFTELTINTKTISALANMTYQELLDFELEEYGFDVSWPAKEIHLNLESFKMVSDQEYMKERMRKIIKERKTFGSLMKKYRENKSEFTQNDFANITEKQIRKYENGEDYPSYESLQVISAAYGMSVNEYLNALL